MSDTTTTPTNSDPQDLINAALGTTAPTPNTIPSAEPQPSTELPPTSPTPTVETPVMPSELTEAPVLPTQVSMGDDTPLAFVGSAPTTATPTTEPVVEPTMPVSLGTSAPMDAVPPVVPVSTLPIDSPTPRKKSLAKTILVGLALVIALVGGIGVYGYQQYGSIEALIAGIKSEEKDCPKGKHVNDFGECVINDLKGGGAEKEKEKARQNANNGTDCKNNGGFWCTVTDSSGKNHEFCGDNTSGRACYKQAIEDKGITMQIGSFSGECEYAGGAWKLTADSEAKYQPYNNDSYRDPVSGKTPLDKANDLCAAGEGTLNFGNAKYICKEGVKGVGGQVYTGGECTELNGKPFTGSLNNFCGVVQVDTGTGHTSYSSTVGCEKTVSNPSPIPSPSVPVVAPKLMCDGITRTPTTTPEIGDTLTFTCTGSSVPAGSVALTYKFRSAIDGGIWSTMTNKTATTSEMTINSCGTYKVQCQACGTISGAVVCDPVWTGATAL